MNLSRWRNRPVLFTVIPIFVVLTLVLVVMLAATRYPSEFDSFLLSVTPQPERATELYLNNYLNFPKTIVKGQTVPFSFTVHNLEGVTRTYPFQVYLLGADNTRIRIASSTVTVPDGASKVVSLSYTFRSSGLQTIIYVELPSVGEKLHFALPTRI